MTSAQFYPLTIDKLNPEAGRALAVRFAVPNALRSTFAFEPGQFLTLRAMVDGQDIRRSYSVCSARSRLQRDGQIEVGIRQVDGGAFSAWAMRSLRVGGSLDVMPPQGRFTIQRLRALHRVGFAAGSGITPILSIMASSLAEQPGSKFTLVYGNRNMDSVMFNEALQDLKDRYPDRLTLIHILSRQAQEVDLLQGRIDADKVRAIMASLLPAGSMDEVFICGPEPMIEATQNALLAAGVSPRALRTERFLSNAPTGNATSTVANGKGTAAAAVGTDATAGAEVTLHLVLDGKRHQLRMGRDQHVLDAALAAGLDVPYSCKGGVCCTCRAKVLQGKVTMDKNFTLERWEMDKGFVLSCQARPCSDTLEISYDER